MYYLGKLIQAAGLTIIGVDYFRNFPQLMSRKILLFGIALFIIGWVVNRYMLKQ